MQVPNMTVMIVCLGKPVLVDRNGAGRGGYETQPEKKTGAMSLRNFFASILFKVLKDASWRVLSRSDVI